MNLNDIIELVKKQLHRFLTQNNKNILKNEIIENWIHNLIVVYNNF